MENELIKDVIVKNLWGKVKEEFIRNKDLNDAIKIIWDCKRYKESKTEIYVAKNKAEKKQKQHKKKKKSKSNDENFCHKHKMQE